MYRKFCNKLYTYKFPFTPNKLLKRSEYFLKLQYHAYFTIMQIYILLKRVHDIAKVKLKYIQSLAQSYRQIFFVSISPL